MMSCVINLSLSNKDSEESSKIVGWWERNQNIWTPNTGVYTPRMPWTIESQKLQDSDMNCGIRHVNAGQIDKKTKPNR